MKAYGNWIFTACIILIFTGCSQTRQITRRSELTGEERPDRITVVMKDSSTYTFESYVLRDSSITGFGTFERPGVKPVPFNDSIRLGDIALVETHSFSFGKTLLATGVAVGFTAMAATAITGSSGVSLEARIDCPTCPQSNSCPSVYAWDGARYVLEGESFGTALGKPLEMQTTTVLPHLNPGEAGLRIRIRNERPETHFINSVTLRAVETDRNAEVVADGDSTLWPVYRVQAPLSASDDEGMDILNTVRSRDGLYWETSLSQPDYMERFEDTVYTAFSLPPGAKRGSVVITAINTMFSGTVFAQVGQFVGDESAMFLYQVEHDPDLIAELSAYAGGSKLMVDILLNGEWSNAGAIFAEATNVPFNRLVRISAAGIAGGTVHVRLRSMKDVWKLDAVGVDWTPVKPLEQKPVTFLSALGPDSTDVSEQIGAADNTYVTLLPPDKIDLALNPFPPSTPHAKVVYALTVRGYLHEWIAKGDAVSSTWAGSLPHGQRVNFLKMLLKQKSMFLPPIYAAWKERRETGR